MTTHIDDIWQGFREDFEFKSQSYFEQLTPQEQVEAMENLRKVFVCGAGAIVVMLDKTMMTEGLGLTVMLKFLKELAEETEEFRKEQVKEIMKGMN